MLSRKSITETIAALLVFLFLYTGFIKYLHFESFRYALHKSPIITHYSQFIAIILPGFEIFLTLLLIIPKTRLLGLYLSLITLLTFTIYLIYMILYSPKLPCTCGGVISQLTWRQHIFFNLFFILLSLIGIYISNTQVVKSKKNKSLSLI